MERIFRPVGTIPFNANETESLTLIRQNPIVALHLDYDFEINVTSAITLRDEHILNTIRAIEVLVNDRPIQRWPARMLSAYNYFMRGVQEELIAPGTGIAVQTGRAHLTLPFILPRTGLPLNSLLPSGQLDSFRLELTFGPATQADVASAGAGAIQNTTVHVTQEELNAAPADLGAPFERVLISSIPATFAAADTEAVFADGLPNADRIRGLVIRASDSGTGFALSDTLLNGLRVETSQPARVVKFQSTFDRLKHVNMGELKLAEDYGPGAPGAESGRIEGFVFVDFAPFSPGNFFDPRAAKRSDLIVDVDAATRLDVVPIRVTDRFAI